MGTMNYLRMVLLYLVYMYCLSHAEAKARKRKLFSENFDAFSFQAEKKRQGHGRGHKPQTVNSKRIECDPNAKYRSVSGTCNNLKHPLWGSAGRVYQRLLDPAYDDGHNLPRLKQANQQPLPSPRLVSTTVHNSTASVRGKHSALLTVWGQFIAHDIAGTPVDETRKTTNCCQKMGRRFKTHHGTGGPCFPIAVPKGDKHFNTSCLEFVRSLPVFKKGVRQQKNSLSAFIDGTTVYGADDSEMSSLRTFSGGTLQEGSGGHLPESESNGCIKMTPSDYCLAAGDDRVNVYPPLAALHTMFFRYHNHIAGQLAKVHEDYDDETLFQEARKIVIAVIQKITFRDYLRHVLPRSGRARELVTGDWVYDPHCDPTLYNVIPTAVLRYGHAHVTNSLNVNCGRVPLVDLFLRPFYVLNHLNDVVIAAATEPAVVTSKWIAEGMRDRLFERDGVPGKDIVSFNIQRGRDHGLPSYNKWRRLCRLKRVKTFADMRFGDLFQQVYHDVDDLDLFSAALVEKRVKMLGATFTCLLARQLARLRNCDRFWWENTDPKVGFGLDEQRQELNRTTLAHVICITTDVDRIQRNVFRVPNKRRNSAKPCSEILKTALDVRHF